MNNGNLLNNLLNINGATASATKASANKTRAEASNQFQQALDQARPEVAARKPVVRKDATAPESRAPVKTAAQRDAAQANNRSDLPKKSHTVDREIQSKANSSPDRPVKTDRPVEQVKASEGATSEDNVINTNAVQVAVEPDIDLLLDPALLATSEPTDTDNPIDTTVDLVGLELLIPEELVVKDSEQLPVELEAEDTEPLQDPGLLAGLLPVAPVAVANDDEASALVAQTAVGQQAVLPLGGLGSKVLDASSKEPVVDLAEEAGSGMIDAGENPDFLLLNSKAALNKLTETNLTTSSLDKTTPAPELAKASPVGALVDSLGRLTEAQSPAARAFVVQTGVPVTVGTPQWSQAVGDKVLWLAAQNVSSAEIRLDPPELGPMQVKVSVNQDQANITFTSPHPVVRDALDQQLNRLREMFSEQGLNLVNVDVSDKSFAQQEREQGEANKGQANLDVDDEELAPVAMTQAISMRLVDHYA